MAIATVPNPDACLGSHSKAVLEPEGILQGGTVNRQTPAGCFPLGLSLFHFNTLLSPIGLEDHVDRLNDFFALIGLTIDDDFVLKRFLAPVNLHHMLLAGTVV